MKVAIKSFKVGFRSLFNLLHSIGFAIRLLEYQDL